MRATALLVLSSLVASGQGFVPGDLRRFRSVTQVRLSPDGTRLAYTVLNNDTDGAPYSQLWIMNLADGRSVRLSDGKESSGGAEWSPDSQQIAYQGRAQGKAGLIVARADGSGARWLTALSWTNSPMPSTGKRVAWSPDSKQLAYVSSVPGPETAEATGDPVVLTRYLYKPDAGEGQSRLNDNRRTHIFVLDLAGGASRPLTSGKGYEHSIDWSPSGDEILFASNREPDSDQFFNYDLFTVRPADGTIRRLTATESIEYRPRWSPDGKRIAFQACKRGLTDLETTMEDTHVWVMDADGRNRREIGSAIDNRQGEPLWSPEGDALYFTVSERGSSHLFRWDANTGTAVRVLDGKGTVSSSSIGRGGLLAYTFVSESDLGQLFLRRAGDAARQLTDLNREVMSGKTIAPVQAFTFVSNDNKWEVEAFLTVPPRATPETKCPMIVSIHGGPHGFQGPAFNLKNQVYASRGWATLMVNYRGSTSYGQAFADGVFGDQNGNEAQDVLYGVSAALRRNPWIDRDRLGVEGGSYGGQLSAWLVTQTRIFKSAIPAAAIINLVSYNYTTYYNQYEQMTFGVFPHQGNLMDTLWERSALKHVGKVATPVMLVHGENDNDVPISEAEQFYIALKDVGVETVFLRYPREGHGLREVKHIIDMTERSIRWHEGHFPK